MGGGQKKEGKEKKRKTRNKAFVNKHMKKA